MDKIINILITIITIFISQYATFYIMTKKLKGTEMKK